ncbi:MAG: hypothetical protein JWO69_1130 [Thermoleophilia bacterium]|nr:hypothetical protein [Thermoleophilia bacterium]
MNATVARLTAGSLLGKRRAWLLLALPLVLLALAVLARALAGPDEEIAALMLGPFALGTMLPLLALLAGTGAIGPEIDDGSIMYLLAKPVRRSSIILAKLAVAIAIVLAFGAVPVAIAGVLTSGTFDGATLTHTVAATIAGIAYCAVFLLLAVVSRNAVVLGLLYAVVWETLVGQLVPGAQALSIQQWSLATTELLVPGHAADAGIDPAVGSIGAWLVVAIVVLATWQATQRLRSIRLTDAG